MSGESRHPESQTLPIVEETVTVDRRRVVTGRVRVQTVTDRVEETLETSVATSEVDVVRVPVGREVSEVPEVRTEDGTVIVPVVEEVPVITTRLILKEEIHIKRRHGEKSLRVPVQLLKQRAVVSRTSREGREPEIQRKEEMADNSAYRTLTAFFDSRNDAEEAVKRLNARGLSDVTVTGGDEFAERRDVDNDKGFWESISDFFFPDEDRATYSEGLRRGGYLVTVRSVPPESHEEVLDILDQEGSVDLDERAESWRAEGWTGDTATTSGVAAGSAGMAAGMPAYVGSTDTGAAPGATGSDLDHDTRRAYGTDDTTNEALAARERAVGDDVAATAPSAAVGVGGEEEVIPVVRESLRVGKRDVNLGRVRVRSYVVEEPVSEDVNLHEQRVEIERRPVDRAVSGEDAFAERTIEAEEHTEEAVVSKDAKVVEEIALRREETDRTETVSDTVRHTEVEVDDDRGTVTDRDATDRDLAGRDPLTDPKV